MKKKLGPVAQRVNYATCIQQIAHYAVLIVDKINYAVHYQRVICPMGSSIHPVNNWGLFKEVKISFQMGLDMWTMGEKYLMTILRMDHQLVSESNSFSYLASSVT